MEWKKMETDVK